MDTPQARQYFRINVPRLRAAVPTLFSDSSTKPSPPEKKWIASFESEPRYLGYDWANALEFVTDDRIYQHISKKVEVNPGNWNAVKQHMLQIYYKGPSTLARDLDAFKRLKQGSLTLAYYCDMFNIDAGNANITSIDDYVLEFVWGLREDIKASGRPNGSLRSPTRIVVLKRWKIISPHYLDLTDAHRLFKSM